MLFDLYVLTLLVYYTGGIESPLFMLFVFHMIIGSLILPGKIIYSLAGLVIMVFCSLTFGEYFEYSYPLQCERTSSNSDLQ